MPEKNIDSPTDHISRHLNIDAIWFYRSFVEPYKGTKNGGNTVVHSYHTIYTKIICFFRSYYVLMKIINTNGFLLGTNQGNQMRGAKYFSI